MSIWSTILTLEHALPVGYSTDDGPAEAWVDIATANSWYGGEGVRLTVTEAEPITLPAGRTFKPEGACVITRAHVVELVEKLQLWLDTTEIAPRQGSTPAPAPPA